MVEITQEKLQTALKQIRKEFDKLGSAFPIVLLLIFLATWVLVSFGVAILTVAAFLAGMLTAYNHGNRNAKEDSKKADEHKKDDDLYKRKD